MATPAVVAILEAAIVEAPTPAMQIYSGICCALAHGVKRLADIIRTDAVELTRDAVLFECYKSKGKSHPLT